MHNVEQKTSTWMFWKKRRHVVAVLAFFGFFMAYILRVNLSIAIVKMTSNRTFTDNDGNTYYDREFDWDSKLQGLVLSSFFYGYISTQLLGGWLAARVGGKRVFGLGIAVTAALTIVTPPITRSSVYLLIAVRIMEGIFEGVTYPAINAVLADWAPPLERTKLVSFVYTGSFVGTVVGMPICSVMAERLDWPSLFYGFGAIGILWYICWSVVVKDRPNDDPHISEYELKYIKDSLGEVEKQQISHPWRAILSSSAVWAIIAAHLSENWGYYTMITQLPTFLKEAFDFKLDEAGFFTGLPYLVMAVMLTISGQMADYLRSKKILTTTQVRKAFNCSAFLCQTIFMTCTAYILTPVVTVTCITIAIGLGGFAWTGFSVNYLDVAPRHASVICGIGNTIATLPGIISPILTGYIVQDKAPEQWRIVFLISSVFYLIGAIIYGTFASGEEQPWAISNKRDEKNKTRYHYDNPTLEMTN